MIGLLERALQRVLEVVYQYLLPLLLHSLSGMGLWGAVRGLVSFFVSLANYGLSLGLHVGVLASLFFALQYSGTIGKSLVQNRQKVVELVYWRDPKKSGIAFGLTFLLLLCLANFSLISVVAYSGLLLLALTVSFRLYKTAMGALGKGGESDPNPLKAYLDKDCLSIPDDRVHAQVDVCLQHVKEVATQLRRLVLVEDVVDTVKFGILLWALTYIGAWFSGITLLALALIGVFTVPKVYELYQPQIDEYWGLVAGHIKTVSDQVEQKLPFLKKKQT